MTEQITHTIQQAAHDDLSLPYPYHLDATGNVARQDFWKGNPAKLIGFQADPDVEKVNLPHSEFLADPQKAVGMFPVFVRTGGDIFSLTGRPVAEVRVRESV